MRRSRWPLFGMIIASALAVGSCSGALVGQYTVTGGLYPNAGWDVPSFGSEEETAHLPLAAAVERVQRVPQYAGYYPDHAPMASSPAVARAAARDFDALYDGSRYQEAVITTAEPAADDWPSPVSAEVAAYSDVAEAPPPGDEAAD